MTQEQYKKLPRALTPFILSAFFILASCPNEVLFNETIMATVFPADDATGEIAVRSASTVYANGDSLVFLGTNAGSSTTKKLTIQNQGPVDLSIESFENLSSPFSLANSPDFPVVLRHGESKDFTLSFAPSSEGGFSETLTIKSDDKKTGDLSLTLFGGTHTVQSFPGLLAWLRAGSIEEDSANTVQSNLTDSGSTTDTYVSNWPDDSGNNNFADWALEDANEIYDTDGEWGLSGAPTAHTMRLPEYHTNEINGEPALRFVDNNNSSDEETPNSLTSTYFDGDVLCMGNMDTGEIDEFTIFVVMKPEALDTNRMYVGSNYREPDWRVTGSSIQDVTASNSGTYNSVDAPTTEEAYCVTGVFRRYDAFNPTFAATDSYKFWINGTLEESDAEGIFTNTTSRLRDVRLGNYYANLRRYAFRGYIAEVIIYSVGLSDSQVSSIHSYLNTKYALW